MGVASRGRRVRSSCPFSCSSSRVKRTRQRERGSIEHREVEPVLLSLRDDRRQRRRDDGIDRLAQGSGARGRDRC
jgi:hypothetical protein